MPKKRMSAKKRGGSKKGRNALDFQSSGSWIKYSGPIRLPFTYEQNTIATTNSSYYGAFTASAGGVCDFVLGSGLITSIGDWSSISAGYHEYRVLGMEMDFQPSVSYTSSYPPLVWVADRGNNGTLGSYAAGANHESAILKSSRYPHKTTIKMIGVEESSWIQVGITTSTIYIKVYGSAFASVQTVGAYLLTFLLQLRGRA